MNQSHRYACRVRWIGATAGPTRDYASYSRAYVVEVDGKRTLDGSADPAFRGDRKRHNPEDLLVSSLAACHMLTYLAEAARAGIAVVAYDDRATGEMAMVDGKMRFREVVLRPKVRIDDLSRYDEALSLHARAHRECFIANSVNFEVRYEATIEIGATA